MRRWGRGLVVLALLGASLASPRPVLAQAEGPIYIVQPGDTLWGIALTFGLDAEALATANGMSVTDALGVGRELVIPGFEGISGVLATRSIDFGETLTSLSLRTGLLRTTLGRLNRIVNPERLFVGQEVIFPQGQGDGLLLPEGAAILVGEGETDIEVSMRTGFSSWALRSINGRTRRLWSTPGEMLIVPAPGKPTTALFSSIESVSLDPLPVRQGWPAEVSVQLGGGGQLEGQLGSWSLNFADLGQDRWLALQGIHAMAEPGMVDLSLELTAGSGGPAYDFSQPVYLAAVDYGFDPILTVPQETIDPATTAPENERVAAVVAVMTPERLWDGVFIYPAPFTESFPSRFGSGRNYNATGYKYIHTGLDFYGGIGTEITAPARGKVVLAEALTVRGNTTILDHGWGVFTAYLHQSEIRVSVGEMVDTGQTIGLVGATGRATGAHLHWEVWVGGVPIDPEVWVGRTVP